VKRKGPSQTGRVGRVVGFVAPMLTRHGVSRYGRHRAGPIDFRSQRRHFPTILSMSSESSSAQVPPAKYGLRARIKGVFMSGGNATRIRKRRRAAAVAWRYVNVFRCVTHVLPLCVCSLDCRSGLLAVGYLWLFALPLSQLGKDTYIDENALQPSQVPLCAFVYSTHAHLFIFRSILIGIGRT
jgi:hypothetical protein